MKPEKRRTDPAVASALTDAVRQSTNVLDAAGDAQLDRLIDQLKVRDSGLDRLIDKLQIVPSRPVPPAH